MAQSPSKQTSKRKRKLPAYKTFRPSKRIKTSEVKVTLTMGELLRDTRIFMWQHRLKMLQFVVVYTLTYLVLVKGIGGFSIDSEALKAELQDALAGSLAEVTTFLALYGTLLINAPTTADEVSSYFQGSLLVLFSLAFIWLVRKLHLRSHSGVTVKQAFYVGMRPLIPFVFVLSILALQLLPAGVGMLLYVASQTTGVTLSDAESLGFTVVAILSIVLSTYLVAGSIFALYIVTLPKMTPLVALRSSMRLLRIHRWLVLRRLVAFFLILISVGFVIMVPFIAWLPRYAELAFFVLGCASFAITHTFMYKLYRSML